MVLLVTIVDGRIVYDERIYDSAGVLERLERHRLYRPQVLADRRCHRERRAHRQEVDAMAREDAIVD